LSQPVSVLCNLNHCTHRYREPQVSTMKMSRQFGAGAGKELEGHSATEWPIWETAQVQGQKQTKSKQKQSPR